MNTPYDKTPGEMSFEDIERVIQHARRMRSETLAEMGNTLRAALKRWIHCMRTRIGAALHGNAIEKCA